MTNNLSALTASRKTGEERIHNAGVTMGFSVLDFWQWSSSDLVANALRGRFAEYIVACALGLNGGTRVEWDAYDLRTSSGLRLEIKSAAYLQSWAQADFSTISFDIRATLGWDSLTAVSATERERQGDVYVFCLMHHKDKATIDALDLSQWTFYVLKTAVLNDRLPTQKRISLSTLLKLSPLVCAFQDLKQAINLVATELGK